MSRRTRSSTLAVLSASLLSLLLASQALAAHAWSARERITFTTESFAFDLVGVDSSSALAATVEWNGDGYDVNLYRTTDAGDSWNGPITLSTDGYDVHLATFDGTVDAVWTEDNRVRYAKSTDGGVTWTPSMAVSNRSFPIDLSVARGPDGLVVVAWQNGNSNRIRARVSTDGGNNFGPTAMFNTHIQNMATSVAAGDGIAYVAYKTRYYRLVVRTSTDGGTTWSAPNVISTDAYGVYDEFDIAASGQRAYIAYTDDHPDNAWGTVRYRRTLDGAATWSNERQLAPAAWRTDTPEIALQGGVLRAVYQRYPAQGVYYQQSNNGLAWSAAELVDGGSHEGYVTKAGKIIVLLQVGTGDVYSRNAP